jgi:hypothetical protein
MGLLFLLLGLHSLIALVEAWSSARTTLFFSRCLDAYFIKRKIGTTLQTTMQTTKRGDSECPVQ